MSRTRAEIIKDIKYFTNWAENYTKLVEINTNRAENCTKKAEEAEQELKEYDEANK